MCESVPAQEWPGPPWATESDGLDQDLLDHRLVLHIMCRYNVQLDRFLYYVFVVLHKYVITDHINAKFKMILFLDSYLQKIAYENIDTKRKYESLSDNKYQTNKDTLFFVVQIQLIYIFLLLCRCVSTGASRIKLLCKMFLPLYFICIMFKYYIRRLLWCFYWVKSTPHQLIWLVKGSFSQQSVVL